MSKTPFRCAIYTRKSTEEGLDQAFNSLAAQREACAAYVKSQASLGWKLIQKAYDDGGLSGATMERPALQALLEEIRAGRVDVVVVYKIDRLTRSLMDFARMVEVFDQHEVSFVSVTQQFNTTTSMGRLTLNVLLSFAQFEREVTAERIRDKIAASKKKGMWMGGPVPMGYRSENKCLVIEPMEAELVRRLFSLYLGTGSVRRLKERVDQLGLITPKRQWKTGQTGGKPFSRGHLYWVLSNPVYAGDIQHQGNIWPGQHKPIIARDVWDKVQAMLSSQAQPPMRTGRKSLLAGLLFDETGDRLSPTHAVKGKRRYRYYISHRLMDARRRDDAGWRLPAEELENAVLTAIAELLGDKKWLGEIINLRGRNPEEIKRAFERSREFASQGTRGLHQPGIVQAIVAKIVVAPQTLSVTISKTGLCKLLGLTPPADAGDTILDLPFTLRRRGAEAKIVIAGQEPPSTVDAKLVEAIAKAHDWMDRLINDDGASIISLAREEQLEDGEISRILPLSFLAPDIVEAILSGRQPVELTARHLKRLKPLPLSWAEQRRLLGFASSG